MDHEERFVVVDHRSLSPEALRGLMEEFVTRQGTDYGFREATHEDKIRDVRRQLDAGEAHIVFDLQEERPNIVPRTRGSARP